DLVLDIDRPGTSPPGTGVAYSPVLLRIDPAWGPIRKKPGFHALLKQYASYRPAMVPDAAS
ncbi:MAG TPA: hypothetical protein VLB69_00520, partial [Rudaea sp.]|nr:hypothetical protein [Rudaea sp.]